MAVSTIFLQTTNEGENEYGDTTFAIHVPAIDKSYMLSVASFMFRPKFILMDTNEYMTLQLSIRRNYPNTYPNSSLDATFFYPLTVDIRIAVPQDVNFNPSKTETTAIKDIFTIRPEIKLQCQWKSSPTSSVSYDVTLHYEFREIGWILNSDNRLTLEYTQQELNYDAYIYNEGHEILLPRDKPDQLRFYITDCALKEITPKLAHYLGLSSGQFIKSEPIRIAEMEHYGYTFVYNYSLTGNRCYNPHYWNYITLSCNKSYNTGNIVNQERFNSDIDESSQFYKGQILAYMPNNAYAPEAMQTGMATANEYIIQPADFNSIRFWLNYDNGEPVKLCSPMTIVLNMMPNQ